MKWFIKQLHGIYWKLYKETILILIALDTFIRALACLKECLFQCIVLEKEKDLNPDFYNTRYPAKKQV